MVMDGRHAENPFPGSLEPAYLQDHTENFNNENPADKKEKK